MPYTLCPRTIHKGNVASTLALTHCARAMGSWGYETFENDDADAFYGRVIAQLEMELAFFLGRRRRGQAHGYQSARAALVLLTALVRGGVHWRPAADVTPLAVAREFARALDAMAAERELRTAIETDVSMFLRFTGALEVDDDDNALDPIFAFNRVRAAGGSPSLYRQLASIHVCHAWDCVHTAAHLVELAACVGISIRTLAGAVLDEIGAAIPEVPTARPEWSSLLASLCTGDRSPLARANLAAALAIAVDQRKASRVTGAREDSLGEWVIIVSQWLDLADARDPDPYMAGNLAHRSDSALTKLARPLGPRLHERLASAYADATAYALDG